jgi:hypothetical protein
LTTGSRHLISSSGGWLPIMTSACTKASFDAIVP